MTDLLLYFALAFLASCVVCAALFWLTRGEKVEITKSVSVGDSPVQYEFKKTVYMVADRPYKPLGWKTAKDLIDEDTRPMPTSKHDDIVDSFDYEELWEAAARIPRESQEEKAKIDRWEAQAFKDAGEDFEL